MKSKMAAAAAITALLSGGAAAANWQLAWQDEFNGTALDGAKWRLESGPGPWGLHELQYYTAGDNVAVRDGALHIAARRQAYGGRDYTSARLRSQAAWRYGRIEARIKLPYGQGMFPAFWMLNQRWDQPAHYGEIDILEMVGSEAGAENATVWGSAHRPKPDAPAGTVQTASASYVTPDLGWFNDRFHDFAVEWSPAAIRYFVDGRLYQTVTMKTDGGDGWSALQEPAFIVLNLAVGGDWAGAPDASTRWPQEMVVDYVRVYRDAAEPAARRRAPASAASPLR